MLFDLWTLTVKELEASTISSIYPIRDVILFTIHYNVVQYNTHIHDVNKHVLQLQGSTLGLVGHKKCLTNVNFLRWMSMFR